MEAKKASLTQHLGHIEHRISLIQDVIHAHQSPQFQAKKQSGDQDNALKSSDEEVREDEENEEKVMQLVAPTVRNNRSGIPGILTFLLKEAWTEELVIAGVICYEITEDNSRRELCDGSTPLKVGFFFYH